MKIAYTAKKFSPRWRRRLGYRNILDVTWAEIIWAAITVGKPSVAHLFLHGDHSISDIIVRMHTVYANLRQSPSRILKSDLYDALDPTEKGATSYFMGMIMAKLIAGKLLDTPWLFHLSQFQATGGKVKLSSNSQPDLIGMNTYGEWVVIEAKGRTNGFCNDVLLKAKNQTRQIRLINGQFPSLRVGTLSYFSPDLKLQLIDPDDYEDNAVDIDADQMDLFSNYYSFVKSFTDQNSEIRKIGGRQMRVAKNTSLGITLGIEEKLLQNVIHGKVEFHAPSEYGEGRNIETFENFHIFPDGIAISLDERWGTDMMKMPPTSRRWTSS